MTTLDKVQLLEQRIIKAAILIRNLEKRNEEMQDEIDVLSTHNEELQKYTETYRVLMLNLLKIVFLMLLDNLTLLKVLMILKLWMPYRAI